MPDKPRRKPEPPDDDLSYEDLDDDWADDAELDPLDLDALDDEIETETEPQPKPAPPVDTPPPVFKASPVKAPPAARRTASVTRSIPQPPEKTPQPESSPAPEEAPPPEPPPVIAETAPVQVEPPPVEEKTAEPTESTPEAPAEVTPVMAETAADSVPAPEPTGAEESAAPPEPIIPPDVYRALIPLPPELTAQVLKLRKIGDITDTPPPGLALTVAFRAADIAAVEAALAKWARAQLPFQFETTSVLARVVGAQQYVAAWALEPEEELVEAQHALRVALAELILPMPGETVAFEPYAPIGEQIAPRRFPHVIAQMQRDFEPFVWQATDIQLIRQGVKPGAWDIVKSFD